MKEDIINKGKDWWAFRKGMDSFLKKTNAKKKHGKPKVNGIANNTMMAPHSAQASNIVMTRL